MKNKYTTKVIAAIDFATYTAKSCNQKYIGTDHLLIGLLEVEDSVAARILRKNGLKDNKTEEYMDHLVIGIGKVKLPQPFTPKYQHVMEESAKIAHRFKSEQIGTEHILAALIQDVDCVAVKILNALSINVQKIYIDILVTLGVDSNTAKTEYLSYKNKKAAGKSTTPVVDKYTRDLTLFAKENKLDPVFGRTKEIERLVQILSRRTKNNPCLVGEPGVGKTAIVEGLAKMIVTGNVPETLQDKRVMTLDLSGMVAGSKYRGEFEERIKKLMEEVLLDGNILLFIDEIHTIIGAGGAEGAIDAANILKPALSRGELQLIGATTRAEYRKYIEKDAALERRFQPISVDEPTQEEAIIILEGLKSQYEKHHSVKIAKTAVDAAVKLSSRYINDRYLPDKAIDLMDEAASRKRLSVILPSAEIQELENKIQELEEAKEELIIKHDYSGATEIRKDQEKLRKKLDRQIDKYNKHKNTKMLRIEENDIAQVIASWTKIPVSKLEEKETDRLIRLEELLHERVIGQDEAVRAVSKAIKRGRVGLKDPKRPIGSFLFLGPTGVGKTELSKALAEAMFGSDSAMIRVDMSEYMEKHSVSKMIGSPPGYVGYEEGGQLSEKVRQNPYSVILFDEVEKAHPDVFNILLQVLDDGHLTDAQGRMVSFKNTVIIMTSNVGAGSIIEPKKLGFSLAQDQEKEYEDMKKGVMDEVKRLFKPEFINRLDEMIVFHSLGKHELKQIVDLMLKEVTDRAKNQIGIRMTIDESVNEFILEKGFDPKYGARPLRRTIQTEFEDELAEIILSQSSKKGDRLNAYIENGKLIFTSAK